jgi:hypothetical protein
MNEQIGGTQKKIESFSILGYLLELALEIYQIGKKKSSESSESLGLVEIIFLAQNLAKNHQK